ncbi:MAG TPA: TetR/AcrR family transcriptional regulator [Beijerinckiaceae bacterium]|jgi:AcrR family transcriptional regulator
MTDVDPKRKDPAQPLGLRERGKQERLRRIKEAAFEAFRSEGYDGASTRDIARMADVSIGTLFVYAKDKRDLLFLVMNEDLDRISEDSIAAIPGRRGPVVDRIVALLTPIYEYFAKEPALARMILSESSRTHETVRTDKEQAARYAARMERWQAAIAEILRDAGERGVLEIGDDAGVLARAIFAVHLGEIRRWLMGARPRPKEGVAELHRAVRAVIGFRERGDV